MNGQMKRFTFDLTMDVIAALLEKISGMNILLRSQASRAQTPALGICLQDAPAGLPLDSFVQTQDSC